MRHFQDKKKLRARIYSGAAIVALSVLTLILLKAVINIYGKESESRAMMKLSEQKLTELQDRNQKLTSEMNDLKTPAGLEEEIRTKLGVAKPGEEVLVLVSPDDASSTEATSTSWFSKFWFHVKSIF